MLAANLTLRLLLAIYFQCTIYLQKLSLSSNSSSRFKPFPTPTALRGFLSLIFSYFTVIAMIVTFFAGIIYLIFRSNEGTNPDLNNIIYLESEAKNYLEIYSMKLLRAMVCPSLL
jgi:hypothetical protein